jgi:hypothetical protein
MSGEVLEVTVSRGRSPLEVKKGCLVLFWELSPLISSFHHSSNQFRIVAFVNCKLVAPIFEEVSTKSVVLAHLIILRLYFLSIFKLLISVPVVFGLGGFFDTP